MGTMGGFPSPPTMLRYTFGWRSRQAPHAFVMGTMGGFPSPPTMLRYAFGWRSRQAPLEFSGMFRVTWKLGPART